MASQDKLLARLPDGALVAVVKMLGSLCPITLGHVKCYIEARRILLGITSKTEPRPVRLEIFHECLGLVQLNGDEMVGPKLEEKKQRMLSLEERGHLVELATAEYSWLCYDKTRTRFFELCHQYPKLHFIEFDMNGADDVVKYEKWWCAGSHRMITMGRPGSTKLVLDGMRMAGINPNDGYFFLGPEQPDISSTAARDAAEKGNCDTLLTMLHPKVADCLLRAEGHQGLPAAAPDAQPSQLATAPDAQAEQRYALDGNAYTRDEFLEFFGPEVGASQWSQAQQAEEICGRASTEMGDQDPFNLQRFIDAQDGKGESLMGEPYETALREINAGAKRGCWIWYVFPQFLDPARSSDNNRKFQLHGRAEALAYLRNKTLGPRLHEIARSLESRLQINTVNTVMGGYVDAKKLHQSVTVFRLAAQQAGNSFQSLYSVLTDILDHIWQNPYATGLQYEDPVMKETWEREALTEIGDQDLIATRAEAEMSKAAAPAPAAKGKAKAKVKAKGKAKRKTALAMKVMKKTKLSMKVMKKTKLAMKVMKKTKLAMKVMRQINASRREKKLSMKVMKKTKLAMKLKSR